MQLKRTFLGFSCTILLAGCAIQPTTTPEPVSTPRPADSATPLSPTLSPTQETIDLENGGFTLTVQPQLDFDTDNHSINLSDEAGQFVASLNGKPYIGSQYTLESFLEKYIAEMESRGGSFDRGNPYEIMIDGISGIAIDLTGSFLEAPMAGKAIAVSPKKDFIFFGLGMSSLNSNASAWTLSGSILFESILESIKFKDEVIR